MIVPTQGIGDRTQRSIQELCLVKTVENTTGIQQVLGVPQARKVGVVPNCLSRNKQGGCVGDFLTFRSCAVLQVCSAGVLVRCLKLYVCLGGKPGGVPYGGADDARGVKMAVLESSFYQPSQASSETGGWAVSGQGHSAERRPSGDRDARHGSREHIAAMSGFFAPTKHPRAGALDYDGGKATAPRRSTETKLRQSAERQIVYDDDGSCRESSELGGFSAHRVRPSMEVAGGAHAAWAGSSGAPERISLQIGIRASTADPRKVSESSSDFGPPVVGEELFHGALPPPPPPPAPPPPESLMTAWGEPPASMQDPSVGPGPVPSPQDAVPGTRSGSALMGPKGGSSRHMEVGHLQQDILHGMGQLDLSGAGTPVGGEPGGGSRNHPVRSSFAAERKSVEFQQQEFSSLEIFQGAVEDGTGRWDLFHFSCVQCLLTNGTSLHPSITLAHDL